MAYGQHYGIITPLDYHGMDHRVFLYMHDVVITFLTLVNWSKTSKLWLASHL